MRGSTCSRAKRATERSATQWGYIGDAQSAQPAGVYVNIWRRVKPDAPWQIVAQSLQMTATRSN